MQWVHWHTPFLLYNTVSRLIINNIEVLAVCDFGLSSQEILYFNRSGYFGKDEQVYTLLALEFPRKQL